MKNLRKVKLYVFRLLFFLDYCFFKCNFVCDINFDIGCDFIYCDSKEYMYNKSFFFYFYVFLIIFQDYKEECNFFKK